MQRKQERMVVEITIYLDVPADITEAEMDSRAERIRSSIADEFDAGVRVDVDTPYLAPRPRSGDAA